MKKDLIKILALLSAVLLLTGCARKVAEPKKENEVNYDAVLKINDEYRIFDAGRIVNDLDLNKAFEADGIKYFIKPGSAAIYESTVELEEVIKQINLMQHGEGYGFQERVLYFGDSSIEDYKVGNCFSNNFVTNSYQLINDGGKNNSSIKVPFWKYIVYTCPVDSKSALELAREQMGLDLK